jgi:4-methylaminobutanoate oxidase (formaldehyde-forming)
VRITYLGELGWELYIPTEHAADVYDRLVAAGADHGLRPAGLQALGSLRLEKAYRDYGHDIDNMDTPIEAGLGFAVKLDTGRDFIGRDALARQKEQGVPERRMLQFLLEDPEPLLHHGEVFFRDGEPLGYIRAGAFGYTLGAAVGLGMVEANERVTKHFVASGRWEIEIAGTRYGARVSLRPLYDPDLTRVKL